MVDVFEITSLTSEVVRVAAARILNLSLNLSAKAISSSSDSADEDSYAAAIFPALVVKTASVVSRTV